MTGIAKTCGAMPASNSSRKYLMALCKGSTAPGAWAQNVLQAELSAELQQRLDIARLAFALLQRAQNFTLHGRPSRHGVHQPHDSRAKNSSGCAPATPY